ncbi:MAG: hypothetical protein IPJ54_08430 [Saprospiraceae bacterium]|nr:hypothetical protein [Saprospiraceae bacterium]
MIKRASRISDIGAKYTFPAGSLIDKNTNGPGTVLMQSMSEGWNDWVAEVEFSHFIFRASMNFHLGLIKWYKMHYDHLI